MKLSNRYLTANPNLVTYPWDDVNDGTGSVDYYAYTTMESSSLVYLADKDNSTYSATWVTQTTYADVAETLQFDKTFTFPPVNLPKLLSGVAKFQIPVAAHMNSPVGRAVTHKVVITLYKNDGVTQNSIASVTNGNYTSAVGTNLDKAIPIRLTVPTTALNVGEYMQVKVQVYSWISTGTANTTYFEVGHDPRDRDSTETVPIITPSTNLAMTSVMKFTIPEKILD